MTYDNELIDLIDIWTELYYMTDKRIHEVRHAMLKCTVEVTELWGGGQYVKREMEKDIFLTLENEKKA